MFDTLISMTVLNMCMNWGLFHLLFSPLIPLVIPYPNSIITKQHWDFKYGRCIMVAGLPVEMNFKIWKRLRCGFNLFNINIWHFLQIKEKTVKSLCGFEDHMYRLDWRKLFYYLTKKNPYKIVFSHKTNNFSSLFGLISIL